MTNKSDKHNKAFIRTFGWPMVTVARDGTGDSKEGNCFGMMGLGQIGLNFHNFNN